MNAMFSSVYLLADLCFRPKWTRRRILVRGMLLLNIVLSQSRTAWVALGAALLAHLFWTQAASLLRGRLRLSGQHLAAVGLLAVVVMGILALVVGLKNVLLRFATPVLAIFTPSLDAGTTMGRIGEIPIAWREFTNHFLTGTGGRMIRYHNEFLRFGVVNGVFGLIAYLWITFLPFGRANWLVRRATSPTLFRLGVTYRRLWVLWVVAAFGTSRFGNPKSAMLYWLFTGVVLAACRIAGRVQASSWESRARPGCVGGG